jgi:ATP-dependent helicase/DNAse subunit B
VQELLEEQPLRIRADAAQPLCEAASPNEMLFWAARRRSQTGMDFPAEFSDRFGSRWQHITETQTILAARLRKESKSAYDGDLSGLAQSLGARYGEQADWSASRLEAYASCPFSFLVSSALGLEVIEPPQIGYQANQLGTILHAVLEQVYLEVPDPANTADVLAHLPDVARRVFATAPQAYQFRPSLLWEVQQAELLLVLEAAIQGIADLEQDRGWRPLAFEAKFGLEGQDPLILSSSGSDIRL